MTKNKTLAKISRLYDLIREADDIAKELKGMEVFVELGGPHSADPLCQFARVHVRIATDLSRMR